MVLEVDDGLKLCHSEMTKVILPGIAMSSRMFLAPFYSQ